MLSRWYRKLFSQVIATRRTLNTNAQLLYRLLCSSIMYDRKSISEVDYGYLFKCAQPPCVIQLYNINSKRNIACGPASYITIVYSYKQLIVTSGHIAIVQLVNYNYMQLRANLASQLYIPIATYSYSYIAVRISNSGKQDQTRTHVDFNFYD